MRPNTLLYLSLWVLLSVLSTEIAVANGRPGTEKVIVYADHGRHITQADVDNLRAERLRDYDAYTVLRVPEQALANIPAVSTRAQLLFESVPDWDFILLRNTRIDTRTQASLTEERAGAALYVVQFVGPLVPEWESLLRTSGVQHIGYLPYNAALVVGTHAAMKELASNPEVQWIGVFKPEHRAQPANFANDPQRMTVQFADVPESADAINAFTLTHDVIRSEAYLSYRNVTVNLSGAEARALLNHPFVVGVEYVGLQTGSGEREAISLGPLTPSSGPFPSTIYQSYPGSFVSQWQPFRPLVTSSYRDWLPSAVRSAAAGYRIAIADTGLDNGVCGPHHPDLPDLGNGNMWFTDYVGTPDNCARDYEGHGTMVTGFAVANPSSGPTDPRGNGQLFNYGMGVSPTSKMFIQKIWNSSGLTTTTNEMTWANDAYNNGCAIQTHSHNSYTVSGVTGPGAGVYSTESQLYDLAVRDTYGGDSIDTPMPVTVSAGNICGGSPNYRLGDCSTMVLAPATAKNVITVGASESYRPNQGPNCATAGISRQPGDFQAEAFDNVAYLSRRGTSDGRIKPDIVAPATMASSTHTQSGAPHFCYVDTSGLYDWDTGTSFAAPQVAAAGLLIDAKRGLRLGPAALKATLVGTSKDMALGTDRYTNVILPARTLNTAQGFGRLNLADFLTDAQSYRVIDESTFVPFTAAGQQRTGTLTVANANKPVILVIAWSDEPANVPAGRTLVRDLDLDVRNGCTRYTGNKISSNGYSTAYNTCSGSAVYDAVNNVEMIVIPPGALTTVSYYVTVRSWGFGTHNQQFALFASNVL